MSILTTSFSFLIINNWCYLFTANVDYMASDFILSTLGVQLMYIETINI